MTDDRRTKAQLLEDLERAERVIVNFENAQEAAPIPPARVPEADALAACIRALDALSKTTTALGGAFYRDYGNEGMVRALNTTQRVIEALAVKYEMPPEKPVMVECKRRHVEEMSAGEIVESIRGRGL